MGLDLDLLRKMRFASQNMIQKIHEVVDHFWGNIWHSDDTILLNILILKLLRGE